MAKDLQDNCIRVMICGSRPNIVFTLALRDFKGL